MNMININDVYVRVDDIRLISKVTESEGLDKKGFYFNLKIVDLSGFMISKNFGSKKDAEISRRKVINLVNKK